MASQSRRHPVDPAARLAGLAIAASLALIAILAGFGGIALDKGSTAALTAGCAALPRNPPPLPAGKIEARGAAEVVGFARPAAPPDRSGGPTPDWVRIPMRFDSFVRNQYKCALEIDVFTRYGPDRVVPPEYSRGESQRVMAFLSAASEGGSSFPVFAIAPVEVADSAIAATISRDSPEPEMPANTERVTYRITLATQTFTTALPSPQAAVHVRVVNTTAAALSADDISKLGISKWTASLNSKEGIWSAAKDIPNGAIPALEPGQEWSTTEVVQLKGPSGRELVFGQLILQGQLITKAKTIESAASQVSLDQVK